MNSAPYTINETNLSYAWARALWKIVRTKGISELTPLVVSIRGFDDGGAPVEDPDIRESLDEFLASRDEWSVEIVAFTIFPQRYLRVSKGSRSEFYQLCRDALPHLKAKNPNLNGKGFYFERLINFGRGKLDDNQLEFIITEYLEGRRRASKFQASIYDPERDQSRQPYQTFPCLQTVSFVPTNGGLVVNAVYAMQYLVQRGYGNFLGLAHLGAFMAKEMGLRMSMLNVVAGVEKLDFAKGEMDQMLEVVRRRIERLDP
jgi:hypothetical protein